MAGSLSLALALVLASSPALAIDHDDGILQVTGGSQAEVGSWPDAAAVYFGNDVGCTGVLVHPRVALTAGHCAGGISRIKLDTVNYNSGGESIAVDRTIAYPGWRDTYDIAVLVLDEEAQTEPRTIATGCVLDNYLEDGAPVAVVGYGATDPWGYEYTSKLMEGFTVITDHDCSDQGVGCNDAVSPGGELGAGGTPGLDDEGVDACYGDSGGPLYLLTDQGDYLVGITSRGYWYDIPPDPYPPDCGGGGIYVRPDAIIEWIEDVSGYDLPRAVCVWNDPPEPTVEPIVVRKNDSATTIVYANDPDEGDTHTFAILEPPAAGTLVFRQGGKLYYEPERGFVGTDWAKVEVTDDGEPPMSAEIVVDIDVLSRKEWRELYGGCGCAAPVAPAGWWLVALVPLVATRRRR